MIDKLQNDNIEVAQQIRCVFQTSYRVEAKLLKATDFPPLKRSVEDFVNSKTLFYGYKKNQVLAGVIEVNHTNDYTYINSLVVDPKFFRQGIAKSLMTFLFDTFDSQLFFVETGLANEPATNLYLSYGFKEIDQWDTDHGVRKIKFERRLTH